jgi:hypothetical protein
VPEGVRVETSSARNPGALKLNKAPGAGVMLARLHGSWPQRDSGAVPRRAHNPEVPGANPGPATARGGTALQRRELWRPAKTKPRVGASLLR